MILCIPAEIAALYSISVSRSVLMIKKIITDTVEQYDWVCVKLDYR